MELYLDTQEKVGFIITDATGAGVPGLAFGDVTCYLVKNGTVTVKTLDVTNWVEDVTVEDGSYTLTLSAADTDTLGGLKVSAQAAGTRRTERQFTVREAPEAVDLTTLETDVAAILADTDAIDTRLPVDPADASDVAAAIAAAVVSVKGADDRDATEIYDALANVASELSTLLAQSGDGIVDEVLTRNAEGKMLTAERRIYDTKANALLDDGVTGFVVRLAVAVEYDVDDTTFIKQTRTVEP